MAAIATNVTNRNILGDLTGTGGRLKDATAHLFSNDIHPDGTTVKADLVESAFDGYSAGGVVVWGAAWTDPDGVEHVTGPTIQATCTGGTTPEQAVGYYVLSAGTGTPLLMAERFPAPISIVQAGDAVFYTPDYALGQ